MAATCGRPGLWRIGNRLRMCGDGNDAHRRDRSQAPRGGVCGGPALKPEVPDLEGQQLPFENGGDIEAPRRFANASFETSRYEMAGDRNTEFDPAHVTIAGGWLSVAVTVDANHRQIALCSNRTGGDRLCMGDNSNAGGSCVDFSFSKIF